jgi:hypothetical protein
MPTIDLSDPRLSRRELHLLREIWIRINGVHIARPLACMQDVIIFMRRYGQSYCGLSARARGTMTMTSKRSDAPLGFELDREGGSNIQQPSASERRGYLTQS